MQSLTSLANQRQVLVGRRTSQSRRQPVRVAALFGFGKKSGEKSEAELDREEQWRVQQEVLQRRREGTWQKEVRERREDVRKYMRDPEYKAKVDAEKRARFKAKNEAELAQIPKFGIIVPLIPIGLPDYDIGEERFDLRLPHVDKGWEDEELEGDWLGLRQLGKAFGAGKKKSATQEDKPSKGKKK